MQARDYPDVAYELETLVDKKQFQEAIAVLGRYPQRSCALHIQANMEWLLDPTTESSRREIHLYKAAAKRRTGHAMHSSWGQGQVTLTKNGDALESVVNVAFSDREPTDRDTQKIRLRNDGSIQVVLLDHGGYPFTLTDPLCLNRQFLTGTMREVNGVTRVVIMLDRSENGRRPSSGK
jgi:hypothetical protein